MPPVDHMQELAHIDAVAEAAEAIAVATSDRDVAIRRAARFGVSIAEIAAAARVSTVEAEAIRDALPGFNPDQRHS